MTIDEFQAQILVAPYPDLEPHVRRGALILVDGSLDLAAVALAVAENDAVRIQEWLAISLLLKAGDEHVKQWKRDKSFLRFLIVRPFVLAQIEAQLAPPTA